MSWCGPVCLRLVWDSVFPGPGCVFPSPGQESYQLLYPPISYLPVSLFSSFWGPCNAHVNILDVVSEVPLRILLIAFTLCYSVWVIFATLFSISLICSSVSYSIMWLLSCTCVCVLISFIVLFTVLFFLTCYYSVEILTMSIYSSPDLAERLYNHYCEHFFYRVECLSLFYSVLFLMSCLVTSFVTYSSISLCFLILCTSLFIRFRLLHSRVSEKWPYIGDD